MPETIGLSDTVRRPAGRLHREIGERVVVMSPESGDVLELNPLGRRIWSALEAPVAVSMLCDALAAETGVPIETARRDTLAFLNALAAHRLVTIG